MFRRNVFRLAAVSLTAFTLVACGEKQLVLPSPPLPLPKVVSLSLSLSDSLVVVSQPTTVTAIARDSAGGTSTRTLRWTSNDTAVAIVSASGVITGRRIGFATISADVDGVTASLPISVALGAPAAIVATGAENMGTTAGVSLPGLPTVFVVDGTGQPVPGITLNVRTDSGAGTIALGSTRTDAKGSVSIQQWNTGTRSGRFRAVVSSKGLSLELFMTVRPDVPATMTIVSGDDQGAAPGVFVTEPLVVRVNDKFNNGVPGVAVTFEPFGGADGGTLSQTTVVSDAAGTATTRWQMPNRTPGPVSVSIRAPGVPTLTGRAVTLGFTAKQVTIGIDHACAIDLTDRVVCWGSNGLEQLGVSSITTPRSAKPIALPTNLRFASISAAEYSTCGIANDGETYCWGNNSWGQLGDPVPAQRRGIAVLAAPRFTQISMQRSELNCGVTADGQLHCWPRGSVWTPQRITMPEPITQVTGRTCALGVSKSVYCWSPESCIAIYDGGVCNFVKPHTTPTLMPTPEPIDRLASGMITPAGPCAISVTSKLYCMRANKTRIDSAVYTLDELITLDSPVTDVSNDYGAGTCAVSASGALYCWGSWNANGDLGTGDTFPRAQPTEIAKGRFVAKRAIGGYLNACAIDKYSQVWCWGARIDGIGGPPILSPTLVVP